MIEREIIANKFDVLVWRKKTLASLLQINRPIADHAAKPAIDLLPMKDLAGVERLREIEIGRGNFCRLHFSKVALRENSVT